LRKIKKEARGITSYVVWAFKNNATRNSKSSLGEGKGK
jgi:hypothetical protein